MTEKTQKEMIAELYQAVIGIPENPNDNGLIGTVCSIEKKLDVVNGRTRANETRSKVNRWAIGSMIGSGGIFGGVGKLLGWW